MERPTNVKDIRGGVTGSVDHGRVWSGVVIRRVVARPDLVTALALMAIVLVGAAVRFTGIDWGRPFVYHPDEGVVVKAALQMVATQDWNPHTFLYPSLLPDIVAGLGAIGHAVGAWPLATGQEGLFATEVLPGQFGVFLAGRVMVAILGLATVVVSFAIGQRLGGRIAGLIAAAIVTIAPIHIESSRFVTTDVPVTLFCALTLAASIRAIDDPGRKRWWIVAAVFVGLATSTKWNGIAVAIVPAALYISSRIKSGGIAALFRSPTPLLMALAAIVAFVAATPAAVFAPGEVIGWLGQQATAYSSEAYAAIRGSSTDNSVGVAAQTVVSGFGLPVVGLAAIGIVCLLAARRQIEFAMALFVIVYVTILAIPVLYYPRNALPALPFVAVAIGLLPGRMASIAGRWRRGRDDLSRLIPSPAHLRVALATLIAVAMIPAVSSDIAYAGRLQKPDTRTVAYSWILANLPHNSIVAREQYTPQLLPDQFRLRDHDGLYQRNMAWYRQQKVQYIIASSYIYGRYLDNSARPFDDLFYRNLFALPEVFRIDPGTDRPGPTIRIFRLDPLPAPIPSP